jgi:hypothetical protein
MRSKWEVPFWFNGGCFDDHKRQKRHGGYFDDHTEAVAVHSSYESMTEEELKVRFDIQ